LPGNAVLFFLLMIRWLVQSDLHHCR
jgi:hypothetical protein